MLYFYILHATNPGAPHLGIVEQQTLLCPWLKQCLSEVQAKEETLWGVHVSGVPPVVVYNDQLYSAALFFRNEALKGLEPTIQYQNLYGENVFDKNFIRCGFHFSINHPVQSHARGDFSQRGNAILWPITDNTPTLGGFSEDITILPHPEYGSILPKGTTVLIQKSSFSTADINKINQIASRQEVIVEWIDKGFNIQNHIVLLLKEKSASKIPQDISIKEDLNEISKGIKFDNNPQNMFADTIPTSAFDELSQFYIKHAFGPHRATSWAPIELLIGFMNQISFHGFSQNPVDLSNIYFNSIQQMFLVECFAIMMKYYCDKSISILKNMPLSKYAAEKQLFWCQSILKKIDSILKIFQENYTIFCKEKENDTSEVIVSIDMSNNNDSICIPIHELVSKNICIDSKDMNNLVIQWKNLGSRYENGGILFDSDKVIEKIKNYFRP